MIALLSLLGPDRPGSILAARKAASRKDGRGKEKPLISKYKVRRKPPPTSDPRRTFRAVPWRRSTQYSWLVGRNRISFTSTSLNELRDKPAGTIRLTAIDHAAETVILPALVTLVPDYPDIKVEVIVDYGLTDIVTERYDASVRAGEQVAKDMIAVRIG